MSVIKKSQNEGIKSLLHIKRVETHANFLVNLPPERFDIHAICEKTPDCGTVACVAGWLPFVPQFKKAGLKAVIPPRKKKYEGEQWEYEEYEWYFKGNTIDNPLDFAQEFLGLTNEERYNLFFRKVTPIAVRLPLKWPRNDYLRSLGRQ